MAAKHVAFASGLTGTASSVTIDVYGEDDPTTKLATVPNGDIDQVGSESAYACDLRVSSVAASLGLPKDGEALLKRYLLVWKDDVVNTVFTRETVDGQDGKGAFGNLFVRRTVVFPSTSVPSRGITPEVIKKGKPSYIKFEVSPTIGDYTSPSQTFYEVFYYDSSARVEKTEISTTVPNP